MRANMRLFACAAALACASAALSDVQHIIIFMQENRAFDHYYGLMRGVRGFNDRTTQLMPNGLPPFYQPTSTSNASEYQLPWHAVMNATSICCADAPAMSYPVDVAMWNDGRFDAWNTARAAGSGMCHFDRYDLPFYRDLIDGFTVGDQYFQSTLTQTNPNRLHLFSGSNGLSAGSFPVLDNTEPTPGFSWVTMAEVLQAAGVSWRVYQETDNFDDNGFAWFKTFQDAQPGNPLYDNGMVRCGTNQLPEMLAADIAAGKLPQVSWIIGPTNQSEHATNHPQAGEDLTARLLKVLQAAPDTYASTVFILNYDEGGQWYDHHWNPTPPTSLADGVSTVNVSGDVFLGLPIGMGFRVPLVLVSPWSRGGYVVSEVFDHTSVLRFVERRFNVTCPNISPWRRAVAGDLMSAFDFENPDYTWPTLPDTGNYVPESNEECKSLPPAKAPEVQSMPVQETGTRPARPLPYTFLVADAVTPPASGSGAAATLSLTLAAAGAQGAAFYLYNVVDLAAAPRKYAVDAGNSLSDTITLPTASNGNYSFTLHGPNGFVRGFSGQAGALQAGTTAMPSAALSYDAPNSNVVITLSNTQGAADTVFTITDVVYGSGGPWSVPVAAGQAVNKSFSVAASALWYDFAVTATVGSSGGSSSGSGAFGRRFMGHMESGAATTSDPAMAAGLPGLHAFAAPASHPVLADSVRMVPLEASVPAHKDEMRWAEWAELQGL